MGLEETSRDYIRKTLELTKDVVDSKGLNYNRLPDWVNGANVEIAHIDSTFLFLIKPSADQSSKYTFNRGIKGDTELLMGFEDIHRHKRVLEFPDAEYEGEKKGIISLQGEVTEEGQTTIILTSPNTCYFKTWMSGYHVPVSISNVYFKLEVDGKPVKTSFVPLALYVHESEFQNVSSSIKSTVMGIYSQILETQHNTRLGNYYENRSKKEEHAYSSRIDNSVIVLGAFDGGERESELEEVRDFLNIQGLSASLIKYLPGHPARSITHKAKTYALTSKFCVIVDIEASGHLVEYAELKDEEIPIALLRKKDTGSSWMLGHEYQTDDYIELFEFTESPLEVMEDVIEWAEDLTHERVKGLEEFYPSWKD